MSWHAKIEVLKSHSSTVQALHSHCHLVFSSRLSVIHASQEANRYLGGSANSQACWNIEPTDLL